MKKIILFTLLIFGLISCEKEQSLIKENLCIEEYTHDIDGVVFKIINDVSSVLYSEIDRSIPGQISFKYTFKTDVDSICMTKFIPSIYLNPFDKNINLSDTSNFTWFTKKGQYACWRYKYIHTTEPYDKRLDFFIPNRHKNISPDKYMWYGGAITCNQTTIDNPSFVNYLPRPVNDTVYVKLSKLKPNYFFQ